MGTGLSPQSRRADEGKLEEERRLCYVGITRARRQLYISYAGMRRMHGGEQINAPSMFLKEIPPEHIVETRPRAQSVRPAFATRDYGRGPGGRGYGEAGERSEERGVGTECLRTCKYRWLPDQ